MKRVKQALAIMAAYYGRNLSEAVLQMMATDLEAYPVEETLSAIREYRQNPDNRTFPLPVQIIGIIRSGRKHPLPPPAPDVPNAAKLSAKYAEEIREFLRGGMKSVPKN